MKMTVISEKCDPRWGCDSNGSRVEIHSELYGQGHPNSSRQKHVVKTGSQKTRGAELWSLSSEGCSIVLEKPLLGGKYKDPVIL